MARDADLVPGLRARGVGSALRGQQRGLKRHLGSEQGTRAMHWPVSGDLSPPQGPSGARLSGSSWLGQSSRSTPRCGVHSSGVSSGLCRPRPMGTV